ncbi:hypothetical protein BH11MYX2_BH11MYX2_23790 [soil metagenome]
MRALLASAVALTLAAHGVAGAEPLPPGSIGAFLGGAVGTGADANTLGVGVLRGVYAAWQPMSTEQRANWALKWDVVWGAMSYSRERKLGDDLSTLQMDLMPGLRFRPGDSRTRYITLRAGGSLLRLDQTLPDHKGRAFAGAVASIGYDWHLGGALSNIDARYSLIGTGPSSIGIIIGVAVTGP